MTDRNKDNIEKFLAAIQPWQSAYGYPGFSYFAVLQGGCFNLLHGRIFLHPAPSTIAHTQFETQHVRAGYFTLSEMGTSYQEMLVQLQSGRIQTPKGELVFPIEAGRPVTTYFSPFHQQGISNGSRLLVLTLTGAPRNSFFQQPDLDWELRSAPVPFESLNELLSEYSLDFYQGDLANVEVVAGHVAWIDPQSKVAGENAEPAVFLAKSLDPPKCQIGFRVFLHGKVIERGVISGEDIKWSSQDRFLHGSVTKKIPSGAVLQCFATYNGFAQHQYWLLDPTSAQNPRRALLEEFDLKLEALHDYLFDDDRKHKRSSGEFEFGVAWLIWMLGFSVSHIGGTRRTSNAPDLLAATPMGNILVVECTTGLLKAENKLANLVERSEKVRKRLASSGNSHLRILPVIVTAKDREEVKADLEQAQRLNILVVTRETLFDWFSQTIVATDADAVFKQAMQSLQSKQ